MKKPLKQQNLEQNSKLDRRQALGLLGAAGTVQIASHVGLSAAFADPLTLSELFDIRLPDHIDEQPLKFMEKSHRLCMGPITRSDPLQGRVSQKHIVIFLMVTGLCNNFDLGQGLFPMPGVL